MTARQDPFRTPPVALTVAGTDSGGAAGVAADLTTFAALGVHGACAVTAVTAQSTVGVHSVHVLPPAEVRAQVTAVLDDLPVAAVKAGMLGSPEAVRLVAESLPGRPGRPLVVDPVLVATSGAVLGDAGVAAAYTRVLLPLATVVTPNLDEARTLLGRDLPRRDAAAGLAELGCTVVLTGGPDGAGPSTTCVDWLAEPGCVPVPLEHPVVDTTHDHGTGCTHSAALAARLAHGDLVADAARAASDFTTDRLRAGSGWRLGRGRGPLPHVHTRSTDPSGGEL
ncbi:bifunctional hydroxymethylpyrimidine kinase/phosphomethylpyrimidine kinase [Nocardioides acrostichi]|uniref:Bifunctional hydroxymethylpyrimidine kinase/phosphomethylpyrimidine kinase n=1 Tax=Nocardioides acrostichi TaxID=2784339 RepID=A0A930UZ68_9ACTN|nr:bifunctional hydroxymethylpyrimidine kinase/phosphomethylpyrimidine kinase [Nocardioides acrostichi]MBF4163588.1 bifunctional hydroxymethylpyrimidine kinase/phosphomethylpyrimidine kinase [Nocardioides acrostichi]